MLDTKHNHALSVTLHYMHDNFVRIHKTLRVTPAMAAGVTDKLRSVADIADMVEAAAPKPGRRGSYKNAKPGAGVGFSSPSVEKK